LKTLVALDLATKLGIGVFDLADGRLLFSDTVKLPKGDTQKRIEALYSYLTEMFAKYAPAEVAIEDVFLPAKTSPRTPIALGELRGVARLCAAQQGAEVFFYPARKVKLAITGYGNACKTDVIECIEREFKVRVKDDNEADAISIGWTHILERRFLSCISGG
jgi:crossover junction endodeoxyribonuclease RuvC